ncbi:S-layer homology domain-containing protein [Paenibacillus sp. GCM10012307]|uniref:S-layer homology domain-containing protein n=1 Tax=Paenibacillus roseus TaxID=2798579 RepID=A0A934J2W9_9BACL|nr:S-layer homology domain-containing protein [Paenibacillus roseus]MBJ6360619.1 S-layer homology domain-containing protein [Paenibacillus roseus]
MGRGLYKTVLLACVALLAIGSFSTGTGIVYGAVQQADIRLGAIASSYQVKDEIAVPILALETRELMGIEFVVKYDPEVLAYIPEKLELPGGFKAADPSSNIIVDEQNGLLKYALIKNQLPGNDPISEIKLATLRFEALKPTNSTSLLLKNILATTGYHRIQTNEQDSRQVKIDPRNDSTKPVITVESSASVSSANYVLKGTVVDDDPNVKLTINGNAVTLNQHAFSLSTTLSAGKNTFVLVAADTAGNRQELTFVVTYTRSGGGGGSNGGGSVSNPDSDPDDTSVKSDASSQAVKASVGGTVQLKGGAKVVIPKGALSEDTTVTIRKIADQAERDKLLPKGLPLELQGDIYEFKAAGDKRLQHPAVFTLPLNPSHIKAGSKAAIYYYHEGRKQWIYLGGQLNAQDSTISVQSKYFRTLAVFTDPSPISFTDTDHHWSSESLDRLAGMKIIKGYNDHTFKPDSQISRTEFTMLIASALGLPVQSNPDLSFADAGQIPVWAKGHIQAAFDAGIIQGHSGADGAAYFDGGVWITRAEMAVMLARTLQASGSTKDVQFEDAGRLPNWAKSSIGLLAEKNIINGFKDNTFRPNANATRAQAATMIYRLLDELGI